MPIHGQWESLNEQAGALAMHAALLSTGQVLYFGGNERIQAQHDAGPSGWDHTRIWTPANGSVDYVPSPDFDVFCCGHCMLGSGHLLVVGGTQVWESEAGLPHGHYHHFPGVRDAVRFHPQHAGLADQLWHNSQTNTAVGAAWTDWNFFTQPAHKAKYVSVVRHADGRLRAFMIGLDHQLWHNDQTSTRLGSRWSGWNWLSSAGDKAKNLVVEKDGAGRLHAFAIGISRFPWLATPQMLPERGNPAGGGRWYPTPLTLPDGRVAVMGGHPSRDDSRHSNFMVEIFDPQLNQWSDAGDEPQLVQNAVAAPRRGEKPEIYPRLHVLPDGTVFCVVLANERSWFWDPALAPSALAFTVIALSADVPAEMRLAVNYDFNLWSSVLLPLRPGEGYRARILVAGGMVQPYVIEPRATTPTWQPTQTRQGFPAAPPVRHFASLVLLPDGTVLMVGGTQNRDDDQYAVLEAEQYNPVTDTWTTLAAAQRPRQYHSTALLLPDGRVWMGGSNKRGAAATPDDGTAREEIMEVFSPPYLCRGPRPTIDAAPTELVWATAFSIRSQNAADIARAVLIRCGSATHGFDADQRFVELAIQSRSVPQNTLVVTAPPHGDVAPPGYYMLFVLDANDVPSHAHMVQL